MAYHTPPAEKAKKKGEMSLHTLSPIPFIKCRIYPFYFLC